MTLVLNFHKIRISKFNIKTVLLRFCFLFQCYNPCCSFIYFFFIWLVLIFISCHLFYAAQPNATFFEYDLPINSLQQIIDQKSLITAL